ILRRGNVRAAVVGGRGQAVVCERLRVVEPKVDHRQVYGIRAARRSQGADGGEPHAGGQEEDPRPECRGALQYPGAGGRMIEPDLASGRCLTGSGASPGGLTEAEVRAALGRVLDPELDRSIVDLGFVRGVTVSGRDVRVELRLPTYWCAPNFSWLMAADAREALLGVPGVERASVVLVDHHAADEINTGVNGERTFEKEFSEQATGGLEDLRRTFRRKAFFVRQDRLLRTLGGRDLDGLRLRDLPPSPEAEAYLAIRAELG